MVVPWQGQRACSTTFVFVSHLSWQRELIVVLCSLEDDGRAMEGLAARALSA